MNDKRRDRDKSAQSEPTARPERSDLSEAKPIPRVERGDPTGASLPKTQDSDRTPIMGVDISPSEAKKIVEGVVHEDVELSFEVMDRAVDSALRALVDAGYAPNLEAAADLGTRPDRNFTLHLLDALVDAHVVVDPPTPETAWGMYVEHMRKGLDIDLEDKTPLRPPPEE